MCQKKRLLYCIMNKEEKILKRGKVDSHPQAIFEMLKEHTLYPERIILESSSQSNWLTDELLKKAKTHL